jgi:hypothetical protein
MDVDADADMAPPHKRRKLDSVTEDGTQSPSSGYSHGVELITHPHITRSRQGPHHIEEVHLQIQQRSLPAAGEPHVLLRRQGTAESSSATLVVSAEASVDIYGSTSSLTTATDSSSGMSYGTTVTSSGVSSTTSSTSVASSSSYSESSSITSASSSESNSSSSTSTESVSSNSSSQGTASGYIGLTPSGTGTSATLTSTSSTANLTTSGMYPI